ncbi:unnamed protein product, partial [Coccothraustes coccothraustes]
GGFSKNSRLVWVGRDLKSHPGRQGHLPRSQAAPSPIQPGLGPFQGSRDSPSCSGHLCQDLPPSQPGIPSQYPIHPCPLT